MQTILRFIPYYRLGTINYFCWLYCFPSDVWVSPDPVTLGPGETTSEFSGDYDVAEGEPGKSWISYVWFDRANPDDSVMVTVEFEAGYAGMEEDLAGGAAISNAYPNPANTQVSFGYDLPAGVTGGRVIITNILGVTVDELSLDNSSGQFTVNTAEYQQGLYFDNFIADGKMIATKKFMVKH